MYTHVSRCILLVIAIILNIGSCVVHKESHVAYDSTVHNHDHVNIYDEVIPFRQHGEHKRMDLSTKMAHNVHHLNQASFIVPMKDKEFILDLEINRNLALNGFIEVEVEANGKRHQSKVVPEHCYYHGSIRGEESSSVVIHTCYGLKGLFQHGKQTYYIEPHKKLHNGNHIHIVYKAEDLKKRHKVGRCGVNHTHEVTENTIDHDSPLIINTHSRQKRSGTIHQFNQNKPTRYVELYLVVDKKTWDKYNGTKSTLHSRALSMTNTIDAIYKTMNVRMVLVGLEYWSQTDKSTVNADSDATLSSFCDYKKTFLSSSTIDYDVAHLLVGVDISGGVLGVAWVGTMCEEGSCGISENDDSEQKTAFTMAHEIGHNLGMNHDNGRSSCNDCQWTGGCVMASHATSNPQSLTQCSISDMNRYTFGCLNDRPTANVADPVCGNGILEEGEICDCGTEQECPSVDPCCQTTGCKLKVSSQCGAGQCCENCQFKTAGSVCRSEVNECDINETCSGLSGQCQEDYFKEDGTSCASGKAYCFGGLCRLRDAQCQYLLGNETYNAVDVCYNEQNIKGDLYGHCGKDSSGNHIKCSATNVQCGKLQCQGGNATEIILPKIGTTVSGSIVTYTTTTTNNSGTFVEYTYCKAGDANLGDDVPNPGLVQDGTKCGDQKICHAKQCKSLTDLKLGDTCGKVAGVMCAGRGSCNQKGDCVCQGNYDPGSFCSTLTDSSTLLTCYACADDKNCHNSSLLSRTERCISNYMSCQTTRLDRGQSANPYYSRGCIFTSKCEPNCTTTQGVKQCLKCCTTDRCNNVELESTTTDNGNTGGNFSSNTVSNLFLIWASIILLHYLK